MPSKHLVVQLAGNYGEKLPFIMCCLSSCNVYFRQVFTLDGQIATSSCAKVRGAREGAQGWCWGLTSRSLPRIPVVDQSL